MKKEAHRYDPSDALSVPPEAAHHPRQEQHKPGDHRDCEERTPPKTAQERLRRADLHRAQIERSTQKSRLGPRPHPRNGIALEPHVHRKPRRLKGAMQLIHLGRATPKGKGPRVHQTTPRPKTRQVDDDPIPVALDGNVLPIYGEGQVSKYVEWKGHASNTKSPEVQSIGSQE
jgi:hypothetical protein